MTDTYLAPVVTQYVDQETGEIISARDAIKSERVHEVRYGEAVLRREATVAALRPEVRAFALFVLEFRNQRRGITPGMDTLVEWYARLHGKRPDNVRRLVPKLHAGGIMAGESLVCPLFQFKGRSTRAAAYAGEDAAARVKFMAMLGRAKRKTASLNPVDDPEYQAISPQHVGALRGLEAWLGQRHASAQCLGVHALHAPSVSFHDRSELAVA